MASRGIYTKRFGPTYYYTLKIPKREQENRVRQHQETRHGKRVPSLRHLHYVCHVSCDPALPYKQREGCVKGAKKFKEGRNKRHRAQHVDKSEQVFKNLVRNIFRLGSRQKPDEVIVAAFTVYDWLRGWGHRAKHFKTDPFSFTDRARDGCMVHRPQRSELPARD